MRYWKSITIIIIVILTFGVFYIQAAIAGNYNPEFAITTTSGDETVLKNLALLSNYQVDDLIISTEGSKYKEDSSYIDLIVGNYTNPKIKQLQGDHRSFMRGKRDISGLYENEGLLAYAEVNFELHRGEASDFSFDIETLDKESGKKTAFTIDVPEKKIFNYVYIEDVRVVDDVMKVTTSNSVKDDKYRTGQIHIYHFNLTDQKLVKDEIIEAEQEGMDGQLDLVRLLNDYEELGGEKYLAFELEYVEDIDLADENLHHDYYPEYKGSELVVYNLETNEQEEIELPDELQQAMKRIDNTFGNIYVHNSKLHFIEMTDTSMEIMVYNLESGETDSKHSIEIPNADTVMQMGSPIYKIRDDKLYVVNSVISRDMQSSIIAVDLATGDKLSEGSLEVQGKEKDKEIYNLHVYDLVIE
ncbi:hypothetical protein [Oceanobacillus chungangensis]|uniref:Uncharacterized protein n=1 Tax=Oceanobacillus chungangensis TaxID=1229152 RepID=A0A3D8PYH0_9BACI|nr:hypothetical protein [Oceanobacillus chungangensis]RDW21210.1 hypothetical protein CWR45_02900 [Oceanobacillus chungangensis]